MVTRRCLGRGSAPLASLLLLSVFVTGCDDDDKVVNGDGGVLDGGAADTAMGGTGGISSTSDASVDGPGLGTDAMTDAAPAPATPLNMFVLRLNANGQIDNTFGTSGVTELDLSKSALSNSQDDGYAVDVDATDRVVVFGRALSTANNRADNDRVVVRLSKDGAVDTAFGDMGKHFLNVGNLQDNARTGFVEPGGKIVTSGYTSQPTGVGSQSANAIVLLRLGDDGKPDNAFGFQGVVNSNPFMTMSTTQPWGMAEAYGVTAQGTKYVTAGYGRAAPSGAVDVVSFRYNADGSQDLTWGGTAAQGKVVLDVATLNDRGRNIATLPDNRILIVGSAETIKDEVHPMIAVLTEAGLPDATFDPMGYKVYDFGNKKDGEAFFGVAVSPTNTWAAAVGNSGGDSALALLPLTATGVAFANKAPLSATENDRLSAATFGAGDKLYATGYIAVGPNDRAVVVARFNVDGSLDTTFNQTGFVVHNVAVGGGLLEEAKGIALQSDGKIIIVGNREGR